MVIREEQPLTQKEKTQESVVREGPSSSPVTRRE